MNTLSYRESSENGLSFELLIDGKFIGDLVGGERGGIPYWTIGENLPSPGLDADSERRIVSVCGCGEYGCGHTSCRVKVEGESVSFSEFSGVVAKPGSEFILSAVNYREVIFSIVAKARVRSEMDR